MAFAIRIVGVVHNRLLTMSTIKEQRIGSIALDKPAVAAGQKPEHLRRGKLEAGGRQQRHTDRPKLPAAKAKNCATIETTRLRQAT